MSIDIQEMYVSLFMTRGIKLKQTLFDKQDLYIKTEKNIANVSS